ncbi:MAG: SNF2-related protein [Verrucomicrobiia bacterium]
MKEGRALWESGKVVAVHYEPPMLHGLVQAGTSTVKARLSVGKRLSDVENLCSCRQAREYGTVCAHVIALGLEFIEQEKTQRNGLLPVSVMATTRPAAQGPKVHALPVQEAPASSRRLVLAVTLPQDLADAWTRGEIQVYVEASVDGGSFRPLDTLSRDPLETYALADPDLVLLQTMEKLTGGELPSLWLLTAPHFFDFFQALIDHPEVRLGKRAALQVRGLTAPSTLHLEVNKYGDLKVRLEEPEPPPGRMLVSSGGHWILSSDSGQGVTLARFNALPLAYHRLREEEITVPRDHLGTFFQRELPNLEGLLQISTSPRVAELEFATLTPQIKATLDGHLYGMVVRLEAVYGRNSYSLTGHPGEKSRGEDAWTPDPDNPLRYFIRNREAENRARHEVLAAGFEVGKHQPDTYTLSSESKVGFFLANTLPAWQRRWEIKFSERMTTFMGRCDVIEPEITISSSGEDWLSLDLHYKGSGANGPSLSRAEIQAMLQKNVSHQRRGNDRILLVPTLAVNELQAIIQDCQVQADPSGTLKVNRRFSSYLHNVLVQGGWNVQARVPWEPPATVEALEELPLTEAQRGLLRPYQVRGVNWLHYLARNGLGGILADEMGLGKTLQTLIYLHFRKTRGLARGPSLIVCPTSLVQNWVDECARFTPELSTLLIHGGKRQSQFKRIEEHDLVITSYALLRRDVAEYQGREFDTIILDEAQHIKNRSSQNAQRAKMLRGDNRLILTGTPIENSLLDLWSMFDFLMPGYLGPATDFKERYEVPISRNGDERSQARLRQRVQPFILRRTKAEVARDLPPKLEQLALCELTDEQKRVYTQILDQGRKEVLEASAKNGQDKGRMAVLTALTRLRQVCCHLAMLPGSEDRTWTEPSAKMDYFFELLDQAIDGGHRVLVFSQFVSLLKLLGASLGERKIPFCYLDGSTVDRLEEVKRFQNDAAIPLFLISLKAGGTGLNLTGADTVVHFDPWWNPAVEDQATARAHRIGQVRIVNSYKLIARGTVEEKIVRLQQKKKELIQNTLVSEEAFVRSLTWEELQGLLE